ncbi:MAG: DJ-1/PfpI family protein [Halobacteriota archaeon]
MRVGIVLFDGFEELDAIGPLEVFGVAANRDEAVSVGTYGLEADAGRVTASHGLVVVPVGHLPDDDIDVLVVPGGGWNDGRGVDTAIERGRLVEIVRSSVERGRTVASVCTGAMALAAAGVLTDRPATTHHAAADDLRERGAVVIDARVVDDGQLVTAAGVTAGLDLALWLIERERGSDLARSIAETIAYEPSGDVRRANADAVGG